MPREQELFREHLERLDARFPDSEILLVRDVIAFTGRSREYLRHHYGLSRGGISKVSLAALMCKEVDAG